jgi:electron transfer flavoprotein beta subunit
MKIVVAVKQVPARDSAPKIASSSQWIEEADLSFEINEPDAYALEEALQLKEKHGGEVITVCLGPSRASQAIRETLAKGADRAIHIEEDGASPLAAAHLLAAAIKVEAPDLVLTGLQSDDLGYGQTGVILAELLGLPHATIVMDVEVLAGAIRVKRELEDGWFQRVELPLPALATIQSGIHQLRYATLMGIKRARNKEVKRFTAADLGAPEGDSTVAMERLAQPEHTGAAQLLTGTPREAAQKLVEKLKFEARVL